MSLRRALLRRSWNTVTVMSAIVTAALPVILSAASQDIPCLQGAARDRSGAMNEVFDDYADEAKRLGEKLGEDEADTLDQTDLGFRQGELDRINNDYTYGMNAAWANLTARLKQVWMNYQQKRVACGFGTTTQTPSYPTSQPPPFGNTNYPPAAQQVPNGWNGGMYRPILCPQQILPPAPSNCSYSCQTDWNGCKICQLRCQQVIPPQQGCACPMIYAPVCGHDGRTYSNSCLAGCAGAGIRYGGVCR
ncbi:MAG: Kazal-type serine protease inhibitor [Candidatus Peribacteraceae bacterium]|nr:Kazal-type serine protease inhibitor [Candidatus Peribacteraceae bacterium]